MRMFCKQKYKFMRWFRFSLSTTYCIIVQIVWWLFCYVKMQIVQWKCVPKIAPTKISNRMKNDVTQLNFCFVVVMISLQHRAWERNRASETGVFTRKNKVKHEYTYKHNPIHLPVVNSLYRLWWMVCTSIHKSVSYWCSRF